CQIECFFKSRLSRKRNFLHLEAALAVHLCDSLHAHPHAWMILEIVQHNDADVRRDWTRRIDDVESREFVMTEFGKRIIECWRFRRFIYFYFENKGERRIGFRRIKEWDFVCENLGDPSSLVAKS